MIVGGLPGPSRLQEALKLLILLFGIAIPEEPRMK